MTTHEAFLELSAAALDFDLAEAERSALHAHLQSCTSCRRRASMLAGDAQAISGGPPFELSTPGYRRIRKRLRTSGRTPIGTLRLVAIAALIAVAALGALQVGAQLVERLGRERDNLIVDAVLPVTPSTSPLASPLVGGYRAGTIVEVVAGGLRVRTAPTVDDATSAKFEPLLGAGARLRIIDGPVFADDYAWYLVEVIGSPQRGWVSSADHDGTPWIADPSTPSPGSGALTEEEQALMLALRPDAAVRCEHRSGQLPTRAVAGIECRLRTSIVTRVGAYRYSEPGATLATYVERMADAGVTPLAGDCSVATTGDQSWQSASGGASEAGRIGCFVDANGSANIRLTCGTVGVGILGPQDGMRGLWEWVWRGSGEARGRPGICRAG